MSVNRTRQQVVVRKVVLPNPKSNVKTPRRKKAKRRAQRVNTPVVLSPCAIAYAKAKLNPFDCTDNESPCIPDILDIPSYKFSTLQRVEFSLGTGGMGFCMIAPNVNANDAQAVMVTVPSFTGQTLPNVTGTVGTTSHFDARFPFNSASARQTRLVACGARVRYIGTELNKGGQVYLSVHNGPDSGFGNMASSQIASDPTTVIRPVSRKWTQTAYNPAFPEAFSYDASVSSISSSGVGNAKILLMATGEPGNSYQVEIVRFYESISNGSLAVPNVSKSHADPVGLGFVKDFLANEDVSMIGRAAYDKFISLAKSGAFAAATSFVAPGFLPQSTLRLTL